MVLVMCSQCHQAAGGVFATGVTRLLVVLVCNWCYQTAVQLVSPDCCATGVTRLLVVLVCSRCHQSAGGVKQASVLGSYYTSAISFMLVVVIVCCLFPWWTSFWA